MRDSLNKELERQELPTVSEEVFNWRMAQATPPIIRRFKKERSQPESRAEGENPGLRTPLASLHGDRIVLPPIRDQPDIARFLNATGDAGEDALTHEDHVASETERCIN